MTELSNVTINIANKKKKKEKKETKTYNFKSGINFQISAIYRTQFNLILDSNPNDNYSKSIIIFIIPKICTISFIFIIRIIVLYCSLGCYRSKINYTKYFNLELRCKRHENSNCTHAHFD